MTGARVGGTGVIRPLIWVLAVLVLATLGAAAEAAPFSAFTAPAGETEPAEPDPAAQRQALERAITLLEDEQARRTLLKDLKALQQGLAVEEETLAAKPKGLLTALSERIAWISESLSLEPVAKRWALLLESAGQDLNWLFTSAEGQRALGKNALAFVWLFSIVVLVGAGCWLGLRYPARRLRRHGRLTLVNSLACVPFLLSLPIALLALPVVGTAAGTRLVVVFAYAATGGAGLLLVFTLLLSLAERGVRLRLVRLLLSRARPWIVAIGASLAAADAFTNQWVTIPLGVALPSLLSIWLYMLTALLCGLLACRHHRLATLVLTPRGRHNETTTRFWRIASVSWQWAVMLVSAASFFGILFLHGEEQTILRAGVISALVLVATALLTALVSMVLRQMSARLKAPPRPSYYLARYLSLVRVLIGVLLWVLATELILQAWGSTFVHLFRDNMGGELGDALASLALIGLVGWVAWITLKTAIERALARESQGLQAQSARSRTLLPLLRSVGLVLIVTIAVITALSSLGVNVTPLLAGAGVLGLAIGFGSQRLVQDLITGLFILFEDTISIGDYIAVAGHEGIVEGLSVRTVRMRDLNGTVHSVPFGEITSVRNLSKDFSYALMNVTVSYREDVDRVINELRDIGETLRRDPTVGWDILEPLEVFGLQEFVDDGMVVRVRFKTRPLRQWDVMRAFNLAIKRRFDELGIELPVRQMKIHYAETPGRRDARTQPPAEVDQVDGPGGEL